MLFYCTCIWKRKFSLILQNTQFLGYILQVFREDERDKKIYSYKKNHISRGQYDMM